MKLNNKGFAISGILYSILILFLVILIGILGVLGSRKAVLDKTKMDVFNMLNEPKTQTLNNTNYNVTLENNGTTNVLTSNNGVIETTFNNCETNLNYTCNCNSNSVCNIYKDTCTIRITNVNNNDYCTVNSLQS